LWRNKWTCGKFGTQIWRFVRVHRDWVLRVFVTRPERKVPVPHPSGLVRSQFHCHGFPTGSLCLIHVSLGRRQMALLNNTETLEGNYMRKTDLLEWKSLMQQQFSGNIDSRSCCWRSLHWKLMHLASDSSCMSQFSLYINWLKFSHILNAG